MDLLDAIELALDLGLDSDGLAARCKLSKNHEKTFGRLVEQVSECGHFIHSYVMNDSFCKNCYLSTSTKMLTFRSFREAFNERPCER
jgi:hypothetical protein